MTNSDIQTIAGCMFYIPELILRSESGVDPSQERTRCQWSLTGQWLSCIRGLPYGGEAKN